MIEEEVRNMEKALALKGHATRGREVIELLKMLGGFNSYTYEGCERNSIFTISNYSSIIKVFPSTDYTIFTLEEFLEKFPYKVGDRVLLPEYESEVRIDRMVWNGYEILYSVFTDEVEWYTATELNDFNDVFITMEDKLINKEGMSLKIDTSQMEKRQIIFSADAPDKTELVLGDNYKIKVEDGKTYVVRKKPQYPKTYKECCEVLEIGTLSNDVNGWKEELLVGFQELLIARDAFWKIAGEEMGLNKPWEPDWTNNYQKKWIINFYQGEINFTTGPNVQFILAFPTVEMRDAFYENFKNEIEQCKELL